MASTLLEAADAAFVAAGHPGLRATRMELALPLELELRPGGELAGDVPLFVTRTAFDRPPARLTVVWEEAPQ